MKTAILLYLYHLDLWDEYKNLILKNCLNYDLFLSVCSTNDNRSVIRDCKKNFSNCFIQEVDNKGVDIGPFLKQLEVLDEKKYPFFIKLHSKKSLINNSIHWRVDLVNSLIGSKFTYLKNLNIINKPYVGAVCNSCFLNKDQNKLISKIKKILEIIELSYQDIKIPNYFVGNIFLSKTNIFKKYFNSAAINKIYDRLEGYGEIPDDGSYNHAMEIINGYIIKKENLKILDGVVKSKVIYNANVDNNRMHLVKLYNGEFIIKENFLLRGKLEGDYIFWKHINLKQKYNYFSNKLAKESLDTFDVGLYRLLNKEELKNISFNELKNHYIVHGKKEGKITKEDIVKVFDENFYRKFYGFKKNKYQKILQDYIAKGLPEGRLYNPIIINDNFDYGFYQSYNNIFNNIKFNQYTALYDYILTKKPCNNLINYSCEYTQKKSFCIYSCSLETKKDLYFLKTNLDILKKSFEKIIVVYESSRDLDFKNTKKINYIKTKINNDYEKYLIVLNKNNFKNCNICLFNGNNNIVVKNLKEFIKKFSQSDCVLYSTTDCYIGSYHIDDSILIFDSSRAYILKTALLESKNKIELSKFIIKSGYKIGSFFQINQVKELFWKNLFININSFPSILLENNVPVFSRQHINYLLSVIPKGFTGSKHKGKIQSFFNINLNKKNINNIFNINLNNIKCCLIIHITDINKLNEYNYFLKLIKSKIATDIYLTTNSIGQKEFIQNKGMDIGPFIKTIDNIDKKYDYIIKLHSKNLRSFRDACFNNIIKLLYHHILLLEKNKLSICSGPKICSMSLDSLNQYTIKEFLNRNNIKTYNTENNFFAGTMFIVKYNLFKDFFNNIIDAKSEYNLLENGSVINDYPTNTHAWERILTNIIPNYYGMKNIYI